MRILFVIPTYLPIIGGAETGLFEITKRLASSHTVHILTPYREEKFVNDQGVNDDYYKNDKVEVTRFNDNISFQSRSLRPRMGKAFLPASFSYISAIKTVINTFSPDIINYHYIVPTGLAILFTEKILHIPSIVSLIGRTDVLNDTNPYYKKHSNFLKYVASSARGLTSITRYTAGELANNDALKIIPYGVDTHRFLNVDTRSHLKEKLNIPDGSFVFLTLQRLVQLKRVDLAIKGMKEVIEKYENAYFIIGGKGPEKGDLEKLAASLGIANNIKFVGYISEETLPEYFSIADTFIFTSLDETFGIVMAQAMAAKLPVIAIARTAIPEVVEDGKEGLLVYDISEKELAEKMIRLIDDSELRLRLGENAKRKAEAYYNWDVIAKDFEEYFVKIINKDA